jgi:hypothetical protein
VFVQQKNWILLVRHVPDRIRADEGKSFNECAGRHETKPVLELASSDEFQRNRDLRVLKPCLQIAILQLMTSCTPTEIAPYSWGGICYFAR